MRRTVIVSLLIGGSISSLFMGSGSLSLGDLFRGDEQSVHILLFSRLPRLFSIAIVGSGLAVSGLILQAALRNRFASPSTIASVDGAKLGFVVALVALPGAPVPVRAALAFAGSFVVSLTYLALLGRFRFRSVVLVPLVGLVLGSLVDATADAIAFHFEVVQSVGAWLLGDFSTIVAGQYELLFATLPVLLVAYAFARRFAVAGLGRDMAVNLGLNYRATVTLALCIVAAVSSLSVVVAGRLPFVGLVVPNLVSLVRGERVDRTIGDTALAGAAFVLAADVLGRLIIHPFEIPIGVTVAVTGSVFFFVFLLRTARDGR